MKKAIILLLFGMLSLGAFSQNKYAWQQATAAGYTYKYVTNDPLKTRFYVLKNGLKVMLTVNKKEPRIRTLIPVRAGSNTDPKNHTGLAHYLEHMLFKGTDKFGSLDWEKEKPLLDKIDALYEQYNSTTDEAKRTEIYKEIDKISGDASKVAIANEYDKMMKNMGSKGTNAHTWYEETVYEEDIPTNAIDRFLAVQAERFRNPILRIFHTELEAVYEEKNRTLDNDNNKVLFASMEALFPTTNYGLQTTIGTVEHLKNPSLLEIKKFYNKYYVPNNMAIIFAGDFNPDEVIKKIDVAFAYMTPHPIDEYNPAPEPALSGIITKEVQGPTPDFVWISYRAPGNKDAKASVLLTVCDEILSNSKAGLIDLNLNKQQKLLNATSSVLALKDYSIPYLMGFPKTGQSLDEAKDLLLSQVKNLREGKFDDKIIKAIAANYKLRAIQSAENNNARANQLSTEFIDTKGDGWADNVAKIDFMSKVTKQEVMDFANKYYGDNYVVVNKRKGEDKSIQKVPKPTITAVEMNNSAASPFLKTINAMPLTPIKPVWLDFKKDFSTDIIKGSELFYVQNTDNALFRLTYRFDIGTWNNKLLPIASQYLEYLSTDKYSSEQISREFFTLASNFTMNVTNENTTLQVSGLNENFDKSVTMFEHLLSKCKPDEAAWTALKARLIKARNDAKSSRPTIRQAMQSYAQYGAKNPFNFVFSNDELNAIKAEDLVKILQNMFNYKHQIIYYGPKTLIEVKSELLKTHSFPATITANPAKQEFKKVAQEMPKVLFTDYEMVQAEMDWIYNTTSFNTKNSPIIAVFNNYFGAGGFSSLVPQTLRESKALAYSTFAIYRTPNKQGDKYTMNAYIGAQADKLKDAAGGMNELLNDLPEVQNFITGAKISVKNNYETARIQQDEKVFTYLAAKDKGLDFDERKSVYEATDAIGYNELKQFHQQNIAKKPYTLCVVASEKKIDVKSLEQYGEVKKMSLEELFGY